MVQGAARQGLARGPRRLHFRGFWRSKNMGMALRLKIVRSGPASVQTRPGGPDLGTFVNPQKFEIAMSLDLRNTAAAADDLAVAGVGDEPQLSHEPLRHRSQHYCTHGGERGGG